jgi:hypothetical protein
LVPGDHPALEQMMEYHRQRKSTSLMILKSPQKQRMSDANPVEECRNLVRQLAKKTEILYRDCPSDQDKIIHIRSMGSTLAALTHLINKLDPEESACHVADILEDARGYTYHAVRSCDLDRLSDK